MFGKDIVDYTQIKGFETKQNRAQATSACPWE